MSDGGAGVIVEVVSLLGRTKAGRVALVVIATYLGLQYAASQLGRAALAGLGVVAAGLVGIGVAFFVRRRRRRERASLHQWLAFFGLVFVAGAAALLLLLRRRKAAALAPPPSAAEVERLAAMAGGPR